MEKSFLTKWHGSKLPSNGSFESIGKDVDLTDSELFPTTTISAVALTEKSLFENGSSHFQS